MATGLMNWRGIFPLVAGALLVSTSCTHQAPALPAPRVPRVVLVHGIFEQGKNFNMLKQRLTKRGFDCLVPKLDPSNGRGGLEKLAAGLKRDIDAKFGPSEPISIVSFSMGGIVSREYLQHLGGAERCENLITISSPHHGTKMAWLYPTLGAEQMRPGSPFLAKLARSQDRLGKMRVASYRTPMDLVILPPTSSVWDRAENLEYSVILHPLMLHSREVLADVQRRLLE